MKKLLVLIALFGFLTTQMAYAKSDHNGFHSGQKGKRKEHYQQQKTENKEFRKTLKNMSPEEKTSAVKKHRDTQYGENKAFHEKMHQEKIAHLKEKLATDKKLTDAQKTDLINFYETQYQENAALRDKQHEENTAFFEKIAADSTLSQEQKKQALRDHFKEQKSKHKDHKKEQRNKLKEYKSGLKKQS